MIVETLTILALVAGGGLIVHAAGVRGWAVPAIGFVLGLSLQVAVTAALATAGIAAAAWLGPATTLIVGVAWWARCRRLGEPLPLTPWAVVAVCLAVIAAVAFLRAAHLVNATPDSFRYLTTSGLIGAGRLHEASAFLLESRGLSVGAMHAAATLEGELYLRSVTPLLALACLGTLGWLVQVALNGRVTNRTVTVAVVGAVALLATNNRFVFNGFYVNGHLLLAALFLLLAGVGWLQASGADLSELNVRRILIWPLIVLPAIVLSRPDAGIAAALVILPLVVSPKLPRGWKVGLLLTLGLSVAAWQTSILIANIADQRAIPSSVTGLLAVGALIAASAAVVRQAGTDWLPARTLDIVEGMLWAAVVVAFLREPQILLASANATRLNVMSNGGWGLSLILLAAIVVAVVVRLVGSERIVLRFPLTSFVPVAILLAYLRGSSYRVGGGDSLNRMLLHYVPLAVLLIVGAFASDRIRQLPSLRPVKERSNEPVDAG